MGMLVKVSFWLEEELKEENEDGSMEVMRTFYDPNEHRPSNLLMGDIYDL